MVSSLLKNDLSTSPRCNVLKYQNRLTMLKFTATSFQLFRKQNKAFEYYFDDVVYLFKHFFKDGRVFDWKSDNLQLLFCVLQNIIREHVAVIITIFIFLPINRKLFSTTISICCVHFGNLLFFIESQVEVRKDKI